MTWVHLVCLVSLCQLLSLPLVHPVLSDQQSHQYPVSTASPRPGWWPSWNDNKAMCYSFKHKNYFSTWCYMVVSHWGVTHMVLLAGYMVISHWGVTHGATGRLHGDISLGRYTWCYWQVTWWYSTGVVHTHGATGRLEWYFTLLFPTTVDFDISPVW